METPDVCVIIYCMNVASLIETDRSGFGARHVLPDYGHVQ